MEMIIIVLAGVIAIWAITIPMIYRQNADRIPKRGPVNWAFLFLACMFCNCFLPGSGIFIFILTCGVLLFRRFFDKK